MTIHHTMGVYANGDRVHNGVPSANLAEHRAQNLFCRPGRAFFIDGVCHNQGYLSQNDVAAITAELAATPMVMHKDTAPYR